MLGKAILGFIQEIIMTIFPRMRKFEDVEIFDSMNGGRSSVKISERSQNNLEIEVSTDTMSATDSYSSCIDSKDSSDSSYHLTEKPVNCNN